VLDARSGLLGEAPIVQADGREFAVDDPAQFMFGQGFE
jgi:hypothetical protein